ncbi:DUF805 domain-containing protein [Acinetobacter sp. C26M]|uniref:DUF805 domain-containing protein n=1 Tax=unclassified Acinetobacter TaxID=196816 RepID=UPI0020372EE9|nr:MULTISPECIES: DUF805 domain-containing protein [unclassified Acinetobacter]USA46782.1 DUF805 domain-containing protein [Acinetobacter sp. C26M]USA50266.1 DUF805 domain-containing protein [Acinetobacter sp. C26G]
MTSDFQANDSGLSANGRFGRLSYLGWNMLLGLSMFILGIIAAIFIPAFTNSSANILVYLLGGLFIIIYVAVLYYSFIFSIRRLHDRNQTGWLSLLMLIPLVNFLFFIYLSCAKGDESSNNYGSPRITKGWEKVLGWIYIILVPISILVLAATAIPAYQNYIQKSQQIQMQQHPYAE